MPQARETGICPVREELYAQCCDELIRQVTINCAERGLLLLRVRDEMRMTIAAYQVRAVPAVGRPQEAAAPVITKCRLPKPRYSLSIRASCHRQQ